MRLRSSPAPAFAWKRAPGPVDANNILILLRIRRSLPSWSLTGRGSVPWASTSGARGSPQIRSGLRKDARCREMGRASPPSSSHFLPRGQKAGDWASGTRVGALHVGLLVESKRGRKHDHLLRSCLQLLGPAGLGIEEVTALRNRRHRLRGGGEHQTRGEGRGNSGVSRMVKMGYQMSSMLSPRSTGAGPVHAPPLRAFMWLASRAIPPRLTQCLTIINAERSRYRSCP